MFPPSSLSLDLRSILSRPSSISTLFPMGSWKENCLRPHFGKPMPGKTPYQRVQELYPGLTKQFYLFRSVVLDYISAQARPEMQARGGTLDRWSQSVGLLLRTP